MLASPPTRSRRRRTSPCRGRSRRAARGSARVAVCRIALVSLISTMNVDWPRTRLSLAPTRVKIRSHDADPRRARRHEAANLRHQHDQADLPQDRRLAGHVRPGENDHPRVVASSGTSFGMNLSRGIIRSTTGCRPAGDVEIEVVGHRRPRRSPRARRHRRACSARRARRSRARSPAARRSRAPAAARSASNSSRSRVSMRSAALSTRSSYSLSAGVTNRSPDVIVCRR